MQVAFTLDDLPLWPMSYPPDGYTVAGIIDAIIAALDHHKIKGVYAFANSWALLKHPEYVSIMDRWLASGHHVANHTHSHIELNDVSIETYVADIELAEVHLSAWLAKAPRRYFRHPLCYWGDTDSKREALRTYLGDRDYRTVEITSWLYEWRWNRAYRNGLESGNQEMLDFVRRSFLAFALAQLRYDDLSVRNRFGRDVIGITVGHGVPFFADIVDELFGCLIDQGVEFVPLERAIADPAYDGVASVPSSRFLVYQQKLADAEGKPIPMVDPVSQTLFEKVTLMGAGQTG